MTPEQLKNSILQLAIQGKLAEQRKEEGTGEELFKEIQEEKKKLIEEGKLKKQKSLPEITEDEVPFDIPETWKWVRLRDIVYNLGQKNPTDTFSYIDISSIDNKKQKLNENETIIEANKAPSRARKIVQMNDILYATIRPYLHNMCIIDRDFKYPPIASTGFAVMTCYKNLFNKYLFYYLLSPNFDSYANSMENSKGVAYPAINDKRLYSAIVPLPPLAEQKRIVEKIEELLPLVDRYEKAWSRLEELNKKFPLGMQKSILQEAIQGKLVEQRKEEGTGEELYKEIQEEKKKLIEEGKLKKQKALPEITKDEIPFNIPETWKWVRLGDICTKIVDGDHNPPAGIKTETNYWMLSAININNGYLTELDRVRYLTKEVFEKENERTKATPGDIFFTIVATLGRSCVYEGGYNICFQRSVAVLTTLVYNYYLKCVLDSGFVQQFMVVNATGTAQKGFYLKQVEKLLIPLPPLAEQKRIVEKIEELLPLCERLK